MQKKRRRQVDHLLPKRNPPNPTADPLAIRHLDVQNIPVGRSPLARLQFSLIDPSTLPQLPILLRTATPIFRSRAATSFVFSNLGPLSREIADARDRIDAGGCPQEGMTESGIATSGLALTSLLSPSVEAAAGSPRRWIILFTPRGVLPPVHENPNRWDNYLQTTEPCPSGRGPHKQQPHRFAPPERGPAVRSGPAAGPR